MRPAVRSESIKVAPSQSASLEFTVNPCAALLATELVSIISLIDISANWNLHTLEGGETERAQAMLPGNYAADKIIFPVFSDG
jgi:hypothetical protein